MDPTHDNLDVPKALAEDLRRAFTVTHPVSAATDRAVIRSAQAHFGAKRRRRVLLIGGPLAAAAAIVLVVVIQRPSGTAPTRLALQESAPMATSPNATMPGAPREPARDAEADAAAGTPAPGLTAEGATWMRGDLTKDGVVNVLDAFALARAIEASTIDGAWDFSGDGIVDAKDIDLIAHAAVKLNGGSL
jgi:hypothetical protein